MEYFELNFGKIIVVAARRGSPLLLGIGQGETFIASDASAIVEYTQQVVYLKDNEIATLTPAGYSLKNIKGDLLVGETEKIKGTIAEIEKGGFKHFMLKEIFEQPKTIANTLRGRISNGAIKLSINLDPKKINRIMSKESKTGYNGNPDARINDQ